MKLPCIILLGGEKEETFLTRINIIGRTFSLKFRSGLLDFSIRIPYELCVAKSCCMNLSESLG